MMAKVSIPQLVRCKVYEVNTMLARASRVSIPQLVRCKLLLNFVRVMIEGAVRVSIPQLVRCKSDGRIE